MANYRYNPNLMIGELVFAAKQIPGRDCPKCRRFLRRVEKGEWRSASSAMAAAKKTFKGPKAVPILEILALVIPILLEIIKNKKKK